MLTNFILRVDILIYLSFYILENCRNVDVVYLYRHLFLTFLCFDLRQLHNP